MKIVWHELAYEELSSIGQKVSEKFGYIVAERVVNDIVQSIGALSTHPYIGTLDQRYMPFYILHSRHNRIFYLVTNDEIRIIAIWNNRMDEKKLHKILSSRM